MSPAPPQDLEPVTPQNRRLVLIVVVATAVIGLDQITKAWALAALDDGPIGLVGGVRFSLTFNTRGAFGLGGSLVPFLAVVAVALVLVVVARGAATSGAMALSLGLVLGGAFGNLADRVFRSPGGLRGAVVDFIDFRVWPVFNLADTAITCGCLLLLWLGWTQREA